MRPLERIGIASLAFGLLLAGAAQVSRAGGGPSGPASVSGPPVELSAAQRAALAAKDAERLAKAPAAASPAPIAKAAPVTTVGPPVDRATAERAAREKVLAIARRHKFASANERTRQDAATSMGVERARRAGLIKSPDRGVGLIPSQPDATHGSAQP
jgi:hypothetical protein